MNYVVVLKYGEMVLKGLNRGHFEMLLLKRIRRVLKPLGGNFDLRSSQSTLMIHGDENADMMLVAEKMKKVFGVVSVCIGYECEKDMDTILATVREHARELVAGAKTFKCNAKRSDKSFPFISPQICDMCGGEILDTVRGIKVDVNDPDSFYRISMKMAGNGISELSVAPLIRCNALGFRLLGPEGTWQK